jgi:hypothetical protein
MTEEQWLSATDPDRMLSFVEHRLSERRRRLFAAACCRRVWHLLPDERSRRAIEVAEAYADGDARAEDLWNACEEANVADDEVPPRFGDAPYAATDAAADHLRLSSVTLNCALAAGHHFCWQEEYPQEAYEEAKDADDDHPYNVDLNEAAQAEGAEQAALLRDVVGDPFRPVAFAPSWRTETVRALARTIHEQRAFDRLPQLADALQRAGCTEPAVLAHCRGPGPHTRGCWVLDGLLEPTQEEWEAVESKWSQVEQLWVWGKISPRKLMLFGVASVHRCGRELPDVGRDALAVAERYADGLATRGDLKAAEGRIDAWLRTARQGSTPWHVGSVVASIVGGAPVFTGTIPLQLAPPRELLVELVGEPFRPVTVSPSWLTPQVRALAKTAFERRDFAILPMLADALEEAGCMEARLLGHCRGKNEHVPGCWVLDLILSKQ